MSRFPACLAVAMLSAAGFTAPAVLASDIPAHIASAVSDAARPEADKQRDANRKPAEVLAFAGIRQGDKVAELLPGRGYFTRIFSKAVGEKGVVYAITPPPRPNAPAGAPDPSAAAKEIATTYPNVRVTQLGAGALAPEPVDVAWTSLNYHDLHNRPDADLAAFNRNVFDALKPGGTYIVIDHSAAAGAGTRDTQSLHRIDAETVKKEVTAVGFTLEGESDVLRNPQDPRTAGVRDPSVNGRTDQFVLKFRKPAK